MLLAVTAGNFKNLIDSTQGGEWLINSISNQQTKLETVTIVSYRK